MTYVQCAQCYLLTMKDGYRNCPDCGMKINRPRNWDYSQNKVDLNIAKELSREYGKLLIKPKSL